MAAPRWSQTRLWDLFDLGPLLGSGLHAYLDVALSRSVKWFHASGGSVFLSEPGDAEFHLRAKNGLQNSLPDDATIKIGVGIAGVVAASGAARIVDDPKRDPDLAKQARDNKSPIASAMVVPLIDHEQNVFGVMNIARTVGERVFQESDLEQAEIMAAQMGLAVRNAQLVDRMSRSMAETQQTNEKLIAVLDSVAGAVLVVDSHGKVVNKNRHAEEMQHWSSQPGPGHELLTQSVRGVIEQLGRQTRIFTERCHEEATGRTWMIEAVPLSSKGGVITVREVTEIENREREMARVKRLAEIGQMTAAIAHEIRNPLTGIRGAAQAVRQHPDLAEDMLSMIDEEVTKLNQLCEDFLEFARPLHLDIKSHLLQGSIERVVALVRDDFEKKSIEIELLPPKTPAHASYDLRRIEQVLMNLLRNAMQASPAGSVVTVQWSQDYCEVIDRGCGMSPDQVDKVFSPFYTTKSDGTGLGLSNCRKIMDAHGGAIHVESKPGQGSRFRLDFSRMNDE